MKIERNVGIINALIRITIGLTVLLWSSVKLARDPRSQSYIFLMFCGAMKVAEGIVRYCPLTALFQENIRLQNRVNNADLNETVEDILPYNPG